MKKLTDKELTIMEVLWERGEQSIRDLISNLPGTAAHFNTIATYVRRLEMHGMITHKELSPKFYLYDAAANNMSMPFTKRMLISFSAVRT